MFKRRWPLCFAFCVLLGLAACEQQSTPEQPDDAQDDGEATVLLQDAAMAASDFTSCTLCHGVNMQGNEGVGAPALAALPAWYLKGQLKAFRDGWRGDMAGDKTGKAMRATALLMGDKTIEESIDYVLTNASKPASTVRSNASTDVELIARGKAQYEEGCASCHGETARGSQDMAAPPLVSMPEWYLSAQMTKFMSGLRGYHTDDIPGQQMRLAVEGWSEENIGSLAAYLQSLPIK